MTTVTPDVDDSGSCGVGMAKQAVDAIMSVAFRSAQDVLDKLVRKMFERHPGRYERFVFMQGELPSVFLAGGGRETDHPSDVLHVIEYVHAFQQDHGAENRQLYAPQ